MSGRRNYYFKWTGGGMMRQEISGLGVWRQCWDEGVRMQSSYREDEHGARVAWYGYDDGGNRSMKL